MAFRITITGLEALKQRLDPLAFQTTVRRAFRLAVEPARAAVEAAAPHGKTGRLSSTIRTRVGAGRGAPYVAIVTAAGYGHLVEYGHREVTGGRVARSTLRGHRGLIQPSGTGRVVGRVPAHPFARPAVAMTEPQMTAILDAELTAALNGTEAHLA